MGDEAQCHEIESRGAIARAGAEGEGESAVKSSQEAIDRAVRARTRHMWVAGLGIVIGGPVLYSLAQRISHEWAFLLGGAFAGFVFWAFRHERALQRDVDDALDERQQAGRSDPR